MVLQLASSSKFFVQSLTVFVIGTKRSCASWLKFCSEKNFLNPFAWHSAPLKFLELPVLFFFFTEKINSDFYVILFIMFDNRCLICIPNVYFGFFSVQVNFLSHLSLDLVSWRSLWYSPFHKPSTNSLYSSYLISNSGIAELIFFTFFTVCLSQSTLLLFQPIVLFCWSKTDWETNWKSYFLRFSLVKDESIAFWIKYNFSSNILIPCKKSSICRKFSETWPSWISSS